MPETAIEQPETEQIILSEIVKHRHGVSEPKTETVETVEADIKQETKQPKGKSEEETKSEEVYDPITGTVRNAETALSIKSIDDLIAEKTGGKYNTFEEFEKYANREEKKLSERLSKLAELEEKGHDIYDIIKYESKGYDKLNPAQVEDAKKLLFEKWGEEEPGITVKELEYKFKKQFPVTVGEDTTDEEKEAAEIAQLALTRQATNAKQQLIDKKKQFELPINKRTDEPDPQELQGLIEQWKGQVTPAVKDYKEEIFSITEGKDKKDFKFVITDAERNATLSTMINPSSIVQRHIDKDGKTDLNGLRRTAFVVENFDKILSVYGQSRYDAGKKEVVEGIENPSTDTRGSRSLEQTEMNPAKVAAADKAKRLAAR